MLQSDRIFLESWPRNLAKRFLVFRSGRGLVRYERSPSSTERSGITARRRHRAKGRRLRDLCVNVIKQSVRTCRYHGPHLENLAMVLAPMSLPLLVSRSPFYLFHRLVCLNHTCLRLQKSFPDYVVLDFISATPRRAQKCRSSSVSCSASCAKMTLYNPGGENVTGGEWWAFFSLHVALLCGGLCQWGLGLGNDIALTWSLFDTLLSRFYIYIFFISI